MKLSAYISENRLTIADFASRIGVDRTTVGRWLGPSGDGKIVRPSWELMSRIAAATGGAVMPNDFMDDLPELIDGFEAEDDDTPGGLPAKAGLRAAVSPGEEEDDLPEFLAPAAPDGPLRRAG